MRPDDDSIGAVGATRRLLANFVKFIFSQKRINNQYNE